MNEPHIEIKHSADAEGVLAVAYSIDMDKGVLALPEHIKIGSRGHDGTKIENYTMQVEEYDIWLEDQIKAQNMDVMEALEEIYGKACEHGVILKTQCCPAPYSTHAHIVKRTIMQLAGE